MKHYLIMGIMLVTTISAEADASENTSGTASFVHAMYNGVTLFHQSGGPRSSLPSCASKNPTRWAMDGTTAAGQNKIAILLTAKALGKSLQVYGTNTCSVWGDTETVDYLLMNE